MLVTSPDIKSMPPEVLHRVNQFQEYAQTLEQINIPVKHFLHAGMYVRSIVLSAGVMITGALIKVETTLIVSGNAEVFTGDSWLHLRGYNVIKAAAHRKQIFIALTETNITSHFPSHAKTVKEAEEEFTDEYLLLQSRRQG